MAVKENKDLEFRYVAAHGLEYKEKYSNYWYPCRPEKLASFDADTLRRVADAMEGVSKLKEAEPKSVAPMSPVVNVIEKGMPPVVFNIRKAIVAGALFDFIGYLTTRNTSIVMGANYPSIPAFDALTTWAKERGLDLKDADVTHWQNNL